MFTLYIANKNYSSWSLRAWVLMRELGIPFQEKQIPLGDLKAVRAISPSGRVPCLVDGDTAVWDSLSIAEYLAERFPKVWPADAVARAWARSAAAEMHSGFMDLRSTCSMNCGVRVRLNSFSPGLLADIARHRRALERGPFPFRRPVPGRCDLHGRRCVLRARRLPRPVI